MAKTRTIGSLLKSKKDPKETYIQTGSDTIISVSWKGKDGLPLKDENGNNVAVTLAPGSFINVKDPRVSLKYFLEAGFIDETAYAERLAKIPDFKVRELSVKLDA